MILIKDRHKPLLITANAVSASGKYDTYKGSTHYIWIHGFERLKCCGKYDTYKGSTLATTFKCLVKRNGKYDTYKGSTLST